MLHCVQHDKKSVILSASEESHSFQCHFVYFVCINNEYTNNDNYGYSLSRGAGSSA